MRPAELEHCMREGEVFRHLRLLPGAWAIVRVDGRSFTRWTEQRFAKPFDESFRELMTTAAGTLLDEMQGLYAYTMSDEISLLLAPQWQLFDRRQEKLVSVAASMAAAAFTQRAGAAAHFDGRVWLGADRETVIDYFRWRQGEAVRNAMHSWCYWRLRHLGAPAGEAARVLDGMTFGGQKELLADRGIDFDALPLWQWRGVGLYWERYEKPGFDPVRQVPVTAVRRRVRVDLELPAGEDYTRFLEGILADGERGRHA